MSGAAAGALQDALVRDWNPVVVALSVVIAVAASYAALDLVARVSATRGAIRSAWLVGGSVALGVGIWSMHFVGMLALDLRLPGGATVPMTYDMALMLLSFLVALGASVLVLTAASRPELRPLPVLGLGLLLGGGIAGMHYIGMASLRLPARVHHTAGLVVASVAIAVGSALVAIWLAFLTRGEALPHRTLRRLAAAAAMGLAIAGVHYTAMAAARFQHAAMRVVVEPGRVLATPGLAATVAVAALIILGLTLFGAMLGRRFHAQREAAERTRQSEERLRTVYDALGFGVIVSDPGGMIVHANEVAQRLLGLTLAQLRGERPLPAGWRAFREDGTPLARGEDAIGLAERRGQPVRDLVVGVDDGGGGVRWLLGSAVPIRDADGAVRETIGSLTDITERMNAKEAVQEKAGELERANAELWTANAQLLVTMREAEVARLAAEAASRAKSDFLATMSHELRTPLNAILGYTELMELNLAGPLSDRQRRYLDRVRASGKHLLALISEILDLARIEAGRLTIRSDPAPLARTVAGAVALVRPQAAARALALEARCDARADALFLGDEVRVRQILANLLSNAVKFTPRGGRITVACSVEQEEDPGDGGPADGPWAVVRVSDTGIGIPADQVESVFEPFVQVDSGHTRTQGGTGLGLAISRQLARLMGGDLVAESRLGAGSTFTLRLPAGDRALRGETPPRSTAAVARDRAVPIAVLGLDAAGNALAAGTIDIARTFADRLRGDPSCPHARDVEDEALVDHTDTMLADMAGALLTRAHGGEAMEQVLADGRAIQRLIAARHGVQRRSLGWTEEELAREFEILRQEVEGVVWRAIPAGSEATAREALTYLEEMLARTREASLEAWRGETAEE